MDSITQKEEKVKLAIEIAIKVGLLAMVIYFSYLIAKQNNPLENTLRFSLLFDFGAAKK